MAGSLVFVTRFVPYPLDAAFAARFCWLLAVVITGALIYTGTTVLLRSPEWAWVRGAFK
jgi:hypothetical protein